MTPIIRPWLEAPSPSRWSRSSASATASRDSSSSGPNPSSRKRLSSLVGGGVFCQRLEGGALDIRLEAVRAQQAGELLRRLRRLPQRLLLRPQPLRLRDPLLYPGG